MAKRTAATHFVVERFNWRRGGHPSTFHRLPGFTRIQSFDTAEEAEAFRHAEEAKARAVVNPFAGTLAPPTDQTDLPEYALHDWYMDHHFDPPKPDKKTGRRDWTKWWEKASKQWKPDRVEVAWEPLHRVRFYHVTERPKVPVGHALVKVTWDNDDDCHFPTPEGGKVFKVYRNRDRAATECEGRNAEFAPLMNSDAQEIGPEEAGAGQFELNDRVLPGRSPFDDPPTPNIIVTDGEGNECGRFNAWEVPFWEVSEIELDGLPDSPIANKTATGAKAKPAQKQKVFLVVRTVVGVGCDDETPLHYTPTSCNRDGTPAEVPVRAFATKPSAEEYARESDADVRATFPLPLLVYLSVGDDPVVRKKIAKQVAALGLPAINYSRSADEYPEEFSEWWTAHAKQLSAEQKAAMWKPFAGLKLHRVKQIGLEG